MAVSQTSFYTIGIECPICKNQNEFEALKLGAYAENGRDTDFCPTDRVWSDPAYQRYNPLLFNFATCAKCYYTRELSASYKEWANDQNYKNYKQPIIKKRHLEELSRENSVVKMLGDQINHEIHPFPSAVLKILLAIFDEKITDKPSLLDIARYFLRIAWLFREHDGDPNRQAPALFYFEKIGAEIARLNAGARDFKDKYAPVKKAIEHNLDAMAVDCSERGLPEQIRQCAIGIEKTLETFEIQLTEIQSRLNSVVEQIGKARNAAAAGDQFGGFADFKTYLHHTRGFWDDIPLGENEAIKKSLEYYIKSYGAGREIKKGLQQLQAAYLIAELSRRVGDTGMSHEYFKITVREAHEMVIRHKGDNTIVTNARKILEMATEQSRLVRAAAAVMA